MDRSGLVTRERIKRNERERKAEIARRSDAELARFERAAGLTWFQTLRLAFRCGLTVWRESRSVQLAARRKIKVEVQQ